MPKIATVELNEDGERLYLTLVGTGVYYLAPEQTGTNFANDAQTLIDGAPDNWVAQEGYTPGKRVAIYRRGHVSLLVNSITNEQMGGDVTRAYVGESA